MVKLLVTTEEFNEMEETRRWFWTAERARHIDFIRELLTDAGCNVSFGRENKYIQVTFPEDLSFRGAFQLIHFLGQYVVPPFFMDEERKPNSYRYRFTGPRTVRIPLWGLHYRDFSK